MFSKKNILIAAAALLLLTIGVGAFWYLNNSESDSSTSSFTPRTKQDETTFSYITNAELTKGPSDQYGDVYITLSDSKRMLLLESAPDSGAATSSAGAKYESVATSPNQRFVAIAGEEFGNPFVLVYQAFTKTAEEKVAGTFTGWTIDGRLTVTQCGEVDTQTGEEECIERTSENSKLPWELKKLVIEDDSILGSASLSPESDFITNISRVGNLSTFSSMIKAGGRFIDGTGPFTVLAPTNAAFSEEEKAEVNRLLQPANRDELQRVLRNHIIIGEFTVAQMSQQTDLATEEDMELVVSSSTPATLNEQTEIEIPDIISSNGIIHIVDGAFLFDTETNTEQ